MYDEPTLWLAQKSAENAATIPPNNFAKGSAHVSHQGVVRLAFSGLIILGILGFYLWKQVPSARSPLANRPPSADRDRTCSHSPENLWPAAVGEVPSVGDRADSRSHDPYSGTGASSFPTSSNRPEELAQDDASASPIVSSSSHLSEKQEDQNSEGIAKNPEPPGLLRLPPDSQPDSQSTLSVARNRLAPGLRDREYPESWPVLSETASPRVSSSDSPMGVDQEEVAEPPDQIASSSQPSVLIPEAPVVPETPQETSQPSHSLEAVRESISVDSQETSASPQEEKQEQESPQSGSPIRFAAVELRVIPPSNTQQESPSVPTPQWEPTEPSEFSAGVSPPSAVSAETDPDSLQADPDRRPESTEPVLPGLASSVKKVLPETGLKTVPKSTSPNWAEKTPLSAGEEIEEEGIYSVNLEEKATALEQAAAQAHKPLFYDNQFDYLEDPSYQGAFLGDRLKHWHVTPWAVLDVGGEYRLRHHSERNHRGAGLTGQDDDFLLHRTRIYANLELGTLARIYAEMNDAASTNETYAPRTSEEDRAELHNLFADLALLGWRSDGLVARLGRQELLYGNQRLVSPLDWANTRRTFEGYKLFWKGPLWTVDAFWTQPVYPNPLVFDSPDQSQQFMGLYLTRRLGTQAVLEGYYLRLVEEDGPTVHFDFHTFGLRSQQEYHGWLGEVEAAVQCGSYGHEDHLAGMYTIGIGRRFENLPWRPTFWMYYDWASGDETLGNGFHHLLPDSHQYLGWMDIFGRRNIEDWNFQLLLHPQTDWTLTLAWHIFHRQHPLDVPYGVEMNPLVSIPGGSGDFGQELDLILSWQIRPRADLSFGYSHFFAGEFFRTNPSPGLYRDDADFFYTQFTLRF